MSGAITRSEVAQRLGKATTSARVEWVMLSPDPEALTTALEKQDADGLPLSDRAWELAGQASAVQAMLYKNDGSQS